MSIAFFFFIAGLIIFIGFFGGIAFERTKISDILILLCIGILLGPVLRLIDPDVLTHFAEYFGAFALMIILFDGGMDLDIDRLVKEFGFAFILVCISFGVTVLLISLFLHYHMGWSTIRSIFMASILGCTSAAIVIPVTGVMSVKAETKTILSLESALSDVFAVVLAISILQSVSLENIGIEKPFRQIASSFSVAIVVGVAAGFLWMKILDIFRGRKYSYMITLAAILVLYSLVEFLGGSGFIAILIFGIILGNCHDFLHIMRMTCTTPLDDTIKFFHGEVTFFIRTFFFVYLGMILSPDFINPEVLYISVLLVAIIFVARYISVQATGRITGKKTDDKDAIVFMIPRGLATAVLATFPVAENLKGYDNFTEYAFGVIIMTNIIMTMGIYFTEKRIHKKNDFQNISDPET
jgi:potassium/hydrogen antiporter